MSLSVRGINYLSSSSRGRMSFDFDAMDDEDSPYPEVRASVSNVDDPEMPALTFRMWVIGLVLIMVTGCVPIRLPSFFALISVS